MLIGLLLILLCLLVCLKQRIRVVLVGALVLVLAVAGCGYAGYVRDPFTDLPAFAQVNEHLYRGGYPKPEGYQRLKALGIQTIVNLSDDAEGVARDQAAAQEYGFRLVHIPLSVYTWPEDEKVLTFLEAVLSPEAQPVYVHCSRGRDCTGAMIAVYRVIVEGKGPKEAYAEALRHGFWPYRGEVVLKKYIHQLKDRAVLYDLVKRFRATREVAVGAGSP